MNPGRVLFLLAVCCAASAPVARSIEPLENAPRSALLRSAREFIQKQDPPLIDADVAGRITQENSRVVLDLGKQRAYLMAGEEIFVNSPMSAGKRGGATPTGNFKVLEKEKERRSGTYGDFVDKKGRVVRSGISMKLDSAPSGTRYVSTEMKYYCRLTATGVGMHAGVLPGYPASHGCIRLPEEVAKLIFDKVKVGTPVEIREE